MFYTEWECDFFFLFFVWILYVRKVVLWRILILLICIEALRTGILIFHTDANAVSVTILYCALPFLSPSAQPFGISHFGRVFRVRAPRPRLSPPDNAQRIQNTHPHSLGPPAFAVLSHQRKIGVIPLLRVPIPVASRGPFGGCHTGLFTHPGRPGISVSRWCMARRTLPSYGLSLRTALHKIQSFIGAAL